MDVSLVKQAEELAAAKRQLEITRREYDRAHGFTPTGNNPSQDGQICRRGGALGAEIDRDGAEEPAPSTELPFYNTPDKNIRAAQAAAEEMSRLEGEELRRQTRRVTELLHIYVSVFRFSGLPEKPRVRISSAKLVGEGFEFRYKTLDEIYDDVVDYGRALGILKY